jgi:RNA polymerase sigma-70 factor (ECF subfamily)
MEEISQELISGCMVKDPKSQREVYEKLKPKMMGYLRRYINSNDDREDIVSIAFTKAFTKIDQYGGKGRFDGWISVIVKRVAYDHLRAKIREREKFNYVPIDEISDIPDKQQTLVDQELLNEIYRLLENVGETPKNVFRLFIKGYTHKEISGSLGISEGTSKWHVYDVKKKISARLGTKKIPT